MIILWQNDGDCNSVLMIERWIVHVYDVKMWCKMMWKRWQKWDENDDENWWCDVDVCYNVLPILQ